jgi:hypothetical protein
VFEWFLVWCRFRPAFDHKPDGAKIRVSHIAMQSRFLVIADNAAYGAFGFLVILGIPLDLKPSRILSWGWGWE